MQAFETPVMKRCIQNNAGESSMFCFGRKARLERLKLKALEYVSANIMIADHDYKILYATPSLQRMLKLAEKGIQKQLPHFVADQVIGSNVDIFHKTPAHNRKMLDALNSTFQTNITVGDYTFNLIIDPVLERGKRIATVVYWHDVSQFFSIAQLVDTAASEVAAGSTDLSTRTEQQAALLEQTSAAMEELTSTVAANASNADQAQKLASTVSQMADNGSHIATDAIKAIEHIERSSQKIVDIISVSDEISSQINLLALNAAVEAARAGQAGRGFAVVAGEVRALAGKSAASSSEIKTLINESVELVKEGAQLVKQAGANLQEITSSIKQMTQMVTDIATASSEQSIGINSANAAITQIDDMTQQNAALVEENTAAIHSMKEQTAMLRHIFGAKD
jgi:methyl-accepting chemotaxis protein